MSKRVIFAAAALGASATAAMAGGVERSVLTTGILFEEGDYAEFSFGYVSPDVSGTATAGFGGGTTGDVAGDYTQLSFGYKRDLSKGLSLALILDQPIGADVNYSDASYPYGGSLTGLGSTATVDSVGLTALLRYEMQNNVSVYGGLRAIRTDGEVSLFSTYEMGTSTETDFGYVVGAAWEKPEIAARVALTYQSEITHDFDATESQPLAAIAPTETQFSTTIPQSVTLEFQTGVAADTLVFGSVKWTDWSEFDISPTVFGATTGGSSLVSYDDDVITYNLGVGRRFNEDWSGALLVGYEAEQDGFSGNLGPTDGFTSLGVAVTRALGDVEITGGARYIWIGDAETEAPGALAPAGTTLGEFRDNSAVAVGLRVGYNF